MANDSLGAGIDALTPPAAKPSVVEPQKVAPPAVDLQSILDRLADVENRHNGLVALAYDFDAFKEQVIAKAPGAWNLT